MIVVVLVAGAAPTAAAAAAAAGFCEEQVTRGFHLPQQAGCSMVH